MKLKPIRVILFLVFFIAAVNLAHASTVRGTIVRKASGRNTDPAQDIAVTLCNSEGEDCSFPFYTDSEGKYYFYRVPAGNYILKIWANGYNVGEPDIYDGIEVLNQPVKDLGVKVIHP